tara:strand:- start:1376 stop:2947 length:1572 start_codon:yes stop_codon:yes gene_type:complete
MKNLENNRASILWIDDEIELLKPHVLYLKEKGYSLHTSSNGIDALKSIKKRNFDLILLDQVMPGIDGLSLLKEIKNLKPHIPVIIITKNEEEWLMDEIISERTAGYLTKPVNPSQIFSACKKILEGDYLFENKNTNLYIKNINELNFMINNSSTIFDWYNIYKELVQWNLFLDNTSDENLLNPLYNQFEIANNNFNNFYIDNFPKWLSSNDDNRPLMSMDVIKKKIVPEINDSKKILFIIIDCLRLDQALTIIKPFQKYFDIDFDFHVSLIPSATPFSRNAIFSGSNLYEIQKNDEENWNKIIQLNSTMNVSEEDLLNKNLKRLLQRKINHKYFKINFANQGNKFYSHLKEYNNLDLISLVVNFIDLITHHRDSSNVIKDILSDENSYRSIVKTWFDNSWIPKTIKLAGEMGYKIFLTTDHGSVKVKKAIKIAGDKQTSSGIRFKYGNNLNCERNVGLTIKKPEDYGLPYFTKNTNYIIAKNQNYFVYKTDFNNYVKKLNNSFQHGGISMEELLIPMIKLTYR